MEQFNEDTSTGFLKDQKQNYDNKTTRNIGIHCLRKKYKCIMLWLLSIVTVSQFLIIVFEKLDENFVNKFVKKIYFFIKSNPNETST